MENTLSRQIEVSRSVLEHEYLEDLTTLKALPLAQTNQSYHNIRIYQIERFVYAEKENRHQKILNLLGALQTFGANVFLLVHGTKDCAKLYVGVKSMNSDVNIAKEALVSGISGNFPGTVMHLVDEAEAVFADTFLDGRSLKVASSSVIPSIREADPDGLTRGLEKLVDVMAGKEFYCQLILTPVSLKQQLQQVHALEQISTALSPFVKMSVANGYNSGLSMAKSITKSITTSLSKNLSVSASSGGSYSAGSNSGFNASPVLGAFSMSHGTMSNVGQSNSITDTTGESSTESDARSYGETETVTIGSSHQLTIEQINKTAEQVLQKVDLQLERLEKGQVFGLWNCAAWFVSPDTATVVTAASTFRSLMLGDNAKTGKSHINLISNREMRETILECLAFCEMPLFELNEDAIRVSAGYDLSGEELALFFCLPNKSSPGISVLGMAEFGRQPSSYKVEAENDILSLGNLYHMGTETKLPIGIRCDSLTSHCFVCGTTGSGKSNTIYHLINQFVRQKDDAGQGFVPFLVIEPAKGEYRKQFAGLSQLNTFCVTPNQEEMLKINPFYFEDGIHVLEHIDRLVEIFNTCWEMYAAMPAILKDAIESAYRRCGWDLLHSICLKPEGPVYPTFFDLLEELPEVIKQSNYSSDTQSDYTGALVTRVKSLTNGIYGQVFCSGYDVGSKRLFDECTIVDLSRVGSSETKALLMGILVLRLTEYRIATATQSNYGLRHVTILEEAHHILKNAQKLSGSESAAVVAKSVEMISNSIAEMRTYGEAFVIVDQSPGSVDEAAIKNTNTKIVMRLPEQSDCEAVGHAMALKPEQICELSRLPRGVAAVMHNEWLEAVLTKLPYASRIESTHDKQEVTADIQKFRSELISAILHEYSFGDVFDSKCVQDFVIPDILPPHEKQEIKQTLDILNHVHAPAESAIAISRTLLRIGRCADMLQTAEKQLKQEEAQDRYSDDSIAAWWKFINISMPRYVQLAHDDMRQLIRYHRYYRASLTQTAADIDLSNHFKEYCI